MSYCDQCNLMIINGIAAHETGCSNSWFDPACVALKDEGTLDTVICVGNQEIRYSTEFAADYRDEDTGEFDLARFVRTNMDELIEEAFYKVDEVLDTIYEQSREYSTTHDDAGSEYLWLLVDRHWPDIWSKIEEYIRKNFSTTEDEIRKLEKLTPNDWSFEMRPAHIFSSPPNDGVEVDTWPVGEIEEQIELSWLEESTGLPVAMISHIVRNQKEHCMRMFSEDSDTCEMYIYTDNDWSAVITDEEIEDVLADLELLN